MTPIVAAEILAQKLEGPGEKEQLQNLDNLLARRDQFNDISKKHICYFNQDKHESHKFIWLYQKCNALVWYIVYRSE